VKNFIHYDVLPYCLSNSLVKGLKALIVKVNLLKKSLDLNINSKDALIIADIQKDFLPKGALAVKESDEIIPVLNEYAKIFKKAEAHVIASRDWHPPKHISFQAQGGPWPPHCVKDTEGAKFSPDLKLPEGTPIISKATDSSKEAYSVFDETGLDKQLMDQGVKRVFICGLATDYCVVNSVLDARNMGLEAVVLVDATRGINAKPGDVEKAFETMKRKGAALVTMADFPEPEPLSGEEIPADVEADKPLGKFDEKKKARMRPKGSYKRVRSERG
jgi:nicotinamidase/pyrazinamidase